jgi:RNA-directed DNA polymerase
MTTLENMAQRVGVNTNYLASMTKNSDKLYKAYYQRKHSGKLRRIEAPNRHLKAIQRWILRKILKDVPISDFAHGFSRGRGIKSNALYHLHKKHILILDLKDFFPSITESMVREAFTEIVHDIGMSEIYTKLCTYKGRLPQGGATSPALSNIIFRSVDEKIVNLCERMNIVYSRYADDMTFSSNDLMALKELHRKLVPVIKSAGYVLNNEKTRYLSGKGKMVVTGITLNSGRMTTGRGRKRKIRAAFYNLIVKKDTAVKISEVLGTVSFMRDIEPDYYLKLKGYINSIKNRT